MNRLTDKRYLANFKAIKKINPDYVASSEQLMYEKLGELEDLEEHYEAPLNVLLKLLDQWSFYFPDGRNQILHDFCLQRKEFYYKEYRDDDDLKGEVITVKFNEHKKLWFVNKDKSE